MFQDLDLSSYDTYEYDKFLFVLYMKEKCWWWRRRREEDFKLEQTQSVDGME
jgi:hypothetical protein